MCSMRIRFRLYFHIHILFIYSIHCDRYSHQGKTTFLEDVHKMHKCIYIRQYHNLRPFITVSAIPNFDPNEVSLFPLYLSMMCKRTKTFYS